ncbi:MAG: hypothetical protein Q9186_005255 [Xanthomendoza sp. 1 TL-2023]
MADSEKRLYDVNKVLTSLADDPERLVRARRRFSKSPPFHKSPTPGSTLSNSPNPPSPGLIQRNKELEAQETRGYSTPYYQLRAQSGAERCWILEAWHDRRLRVPTHVDFDTLAEEVVKKRWREQGIWNDKWDKDSFRYGWRWKHQEPLQDPSDTELQSEAPPKGLFDDLFTSSASRSDVKLIKLPPTAEQQRQLEREREASRPINQFLWQMSRVRDLICGEPVLQEVAMSASLDINTKAYENVRDTWIRRFIWDPEWGIMPGMSWMHERSKNKIFHTDPIHAHHRKGSFAITEVEAEGLRLKSELPPPPPLPPVICTNSFNLFFDVPVGPSSIAPCVGSERLSGPRDEDSNGLFGADVLNPPRSPVVTAVDGVDDSDPRHAAPVPGPSSSIAEQVSRGGENQKVAFSKTSQSLPGIQERLRPIRPSRVTKPQGQKVRASEQATATRAVDGRYDRRESIDTPEMPDYPSPRRSKRRRHEIMEQGSCDGSSADNQTRPKKFSKASSRLK